MNKYGLSEKEQNAIVSLFEKHTAIHEVILFGSRAMNTFTTTSDIDFALKGKNISTVIGALKSDFDNSSIIYEVDVINYKNISSEALLAHIKKHGKVFYRKGWVETTLGEVAVISSSKRIFYSDYVSEGVPFYRSKEVIEKQKGNDISTELYITKLKFNEISKKYGSPKKNDLLLTSVGTLGIPYLVKENEIFYFKDGNLTWFRGYQGLEPFFLYYFFLSAIGKKRLGEITIGSTQSALTIAGLKTISIKLPSLPEQKVIADILSSFDEKIELLREQNETLETLAQTIFKEWFVNFNYPNATGEMVDSELGEIPKGWRSGSIGDVLELRYGKSLKTEDRTGSGFPVYGSNGIVGYHKKYLVEGPGIIVGRKGSMGEVVWCNNNFYPIDTAFYVSDLLDMVDLFFHYFLLKRYNFEKIGSDSAVPGLNRNAVYVIDVVVPSLEIIEKFNAVCEFIFEKSENNTSQIQTLLKTRDILLPRLMSGEIRGREQ